MIVECETTVKVVVKYSFSIGAFLVNLFNFVTVHHQKISMEDIYLKYQEGTI